jgi:GntR family transcriptional regulator/MocR family aminotransferase
MRRWELTVALDPHADLPLFLQLARAIADDIRQERLHPGDSLPGSRALAQSLGVHRNTVIAGYAELHAEGLVVTRSGGGTFVAAPAPSPPPSPLPPAVERPSYALAPPLPMQPSNVIPPGTLMLSRGMPDVRLLPAEALARAYRRAIGRHGRGLLTYGDPRGHLRLRQELGTFLSRTRGLSANSDRVLVTRGSQMAIDLTARALVSRGDVVAVEALGHRPAWTALKLSGAELAPVAVDDEGLDVAELGALAQSRPLRAVYVTPHHQFPTTAVMSPARRAALAELAARHRFAVIEDDYDHEFHYEGRPILPIAAGQGRANIIYLGSLSKVLAPGLRAGFLVAPPSVIDRVVSLREAVDLQGDGAVEAALAELFEDGEVQRHVRRMRRTYAARRDALAAALARHLGGALSFRVPDGGMAIWARVADELDAEAWASAAAVEGVLVRGARMYDFYERPQNFFRLGFSFHDEAELDEAARRLARARTTLSAHRRTATGSAGEGSRSGHRRRRPDA